MRAIISTEIADRRTVFQEQERKREWKSKRHVDM